MTIAMTNHLVIWNQTYLEGISWESLKTDFMSRRNVFQFLSLILYLILIHTILCLDNIHYNVLQQFDTFGDGMNFISLINDQKWIMSRRNVFRIMPNFYVKADFLHFRACKLKKTNTHTDTSIYENGMSVQHLPGMISLWHNFVAVWHCYSMKLLWCDNFMALLKTFEVWTHTLILW